MMDEKTVATICERSAAGEGVAAILESLKINVDEGLRYLQKNHAQAIRDAKLKQLAARGTLTESASVEHAKMIERTAQIKVT